MKEDGKSIVSSLKNWAVVRAIRGNEMYSTFGTNGEIRCFKYLSLLVWRKNNFQGQWLVEGIILK